MKELNQWYLKVSEYPKDKDWLTKITNLVYLTDYNSDLDVYSGYCITHDEYGETGNDLKESSNATHMGFKDIPRLSLLEYKLISYKEARDYIEAFTAKYFNLCN